MLNWSSSSCKVSYISSYSCVLLSRCLNKKTVRSRKKKIIDLCLEFVHCFVLVSYILLFVRCLNTFKSSSIYVSVISKVLTKLHSPPHLQLLFVSSVFIRVRPPSIYIHNIYTNIYTYINTGDITIQNRGTPT